MRRSALVIWFLAGLAFWSMPGGLFRAAEKDKLFVATPLTAEKAFTAGIEGPACDAKGNIYVVNFAKQQTIGKITPQGKGEVFVVLPGTSTGNGIVFDRKGLMYVADYVGHNILRIDPATRKVTVFAHNNKMYQPNDLAIAPDGTLYASDPDWTKSKGQVCASARTARPPGSPRRWGPPTASRSVRTAKRFT